MEHPIVETLFRTLPAICAAWSTCLAVDMATRDTVPNSERQQTATLICLASILAFAVLLLRMAPSGWDLAFTLAFVAVGYLAGRPTSGPHCPGEQFLHSDERELKEIRMELRLLQQRAEHLADSTERELLSCRASLIGDGIAMIEEGLSCADGPAEDPAPLVEELLAYEEALHEDPY